VQTITYFLLITRYLQACKITPSGDDNSLLVFNTDYVIYTCLKILYVAVLVVILARIAMKSELFKPYMKKLVFSLIVMILSIVKELASLLFIVDT